MRKRRRTPLPAVAGLPVRIGVRIVALSHLDQADAARERHLRRRDDEALHDFRVALRRLRTGLRACRPYFEDTVRRGDRRRLREIARATGSARDLEVQLDWLEREGRDPVWTATMNTVAERLRREQREAGREAARAIHLFPATSKRLRARLSRYTDRIDATTPLRADSLGHVAAQLIAAHVAHLRAQLDAVESPVPGEPVHSARISGKRLRYLVEPFRDEVDNGRRLVRLLRSLQDDLGEVHDLGVMLELLRGPPGEEAGVEGAEAVEAVESSGRLLEHLRDRQLARFDQARAVWWGVRGRRLFREAEAFVHALAARFPVAGIEIERKFRLRALPRRRKDRTVVRIDQGWLPGDRVVERIRRIRGQDGTRFVRTIKTGHGLVRTEIEEDIPEALFRSLWRLTRGRRVHKRRYTFRDGNLVWEIDRFIGRDLVIAEVELDTADAEVTPPPWLKRYIVEEVTGDRRYENVNLAS